MSVQDIYPPLDAELSLSVQEWRIWVVQFIPGNVQGLFQDWSDRNYRLRLPRNWNPSCFTEQKQENFL